MKLTFLGADHEVTGSCYYLEAAGKKILDHSGNLPLLYRHGFHGQIFSTYGTANLCSIMLLDSAHIQEFEAEWKNRKNQRAGRELVEPLYSIEDAQGAIKCFVNLNYEEERYIADGIKVRFFDAGHLLGSASIEVTITEGDTTRSVIFSGDIGNTNQPLIRDPVYPKKADYVVMESTYGDRAHPRPPRSDYAQALAEVIQRTFDRGGNVVIPSFAVGRTQEMLYFIREIKEKHMVSGHEGFKVYVDSPLANEATQVFQKRMYEDFDEEATALLQKGINPIGFDGLKTAVTADDSRAINFIEEPKAIISASGMCDAGRIKHHLKHNLWRPECTILFVGYQAAGTPGRALLEGADHLRLFGEDIDVEAEICQLPGVSGHADNEGLMRWISSMEAKPQKVFVTHGEDHVTEIFRDRLKDELGLDAYAPYSGAEFDLASGQITVDAQPVLLSKEKQKGLAEAKAAGGAFVRRKGSDRGAAVRVTSQTRKAAQVYTKLVAAGSRLMSVIRDSEGGANKDLSEFTQDILRLCEKWKR